MKAASLSLLVILCASAAARAQEPEKLLPVGAREEEFVAWMPATADTVSRRVPFGEGVTILTDVYESTDGGAHFMVLSFPRWQMPDDPVALKTFDSFTSGFEYSVRSNPHTQGNTLKREEDFTLRGMKVRPYRVRMGGREGVARLYEAAGRFYVVMVLGTTHGDARVDRFLRDFRVTPRALFLQWEEEIGALDRTSLKRGPLTERPWTPPPPGPWPRLRLGPRTEPLVLGNIDGAAISRPAPKYPRVALAARVFGIVEVQITYDEEGKVISAHAVSGHPLLRQAAVEASYESRFKRIRLSGEPVKVTGTIRFHFNLQ
jgi:TonB family protein